MNPLQINAIVSSHCSKDQIAYRVDPAVSQAVIDKANDDRTDDHRFSLAPDDSTIVIFSAKDVLKWSQRAVPPIAQCLRDAYELVCKEESDKQAEHQQIVERLSRLTGLRVEHETPGALIHF